MSPEIPCPACGSPTPPGSFCAKDGTLALGPGARLGPYELVDLLGKGGMGEVWRGRHTELEQLVAIKILSEECAKKPQVVARFKGEALAVNQIQNRHIINVFHFGELPGKRPYFAMELLQGQDLGAYLKQSGPLPFGEIVDLMAQVCRGLGAAHDKGFVHRDLKPDNIFLVRDPKEPLFVKLLDFGIAKLADDAKLASPTVAQVETRQGQVFGTPAYMSPEQCQDAKSVTPASDLYALAAIAYELITGKRAFQDPRDNLPTILTRHTHLPPPTLAEKLPQYRQGLSILPALERFFQRAFAKDPASRHQRCDAFLTELTLAVGVFATEDQDALLSLKAGEATLDEGPPPAADPTLARTQPAPEDATQAPSGKLLRPKLPPEALPHKRLPPARTLVEPTPGPAQEDIPTTSVEPPPPAATAATRYAIIAAVLAALIALAVVFLRG